MQTKPSRPLIPYYIAVIWFVVAVPKTYDYFQTRQALRAWDHAELLLQQGNSKEAERVLIDVAKTLPDKAYVYSLLGEAQMKNGKYLDAIQSFDQVLSLSHGKSYDSTYRDMAIAYEKLGSPLQAEAVRARAREAEGK